MTSPLIRLFEGVMIGLILLSAAVGITPRISQAQEEGRVGVLSDCLQRVRASIAVYQAEHDGALPVLTGQGRAGGQEFAACLTSRDAQGRGPYLKAIPANPFASRETAGLVTVVCDPNATPVGEEGTGWWFNAATGHFAACDSSYHAAF